MSLFSGKKLSVEIYGESHAEKIGVSVKGLPRFKFDREELDTFLARRKATLSVFSTSRIEPDKPVFYGVKDGEISGDFTAEIINENKISKDYAPLYGKPRPSHADYAWHVKDGALDFSGGGRFSARLTAPLCIVGGILKQYLKQRGIEIESYVSSVGNINAKSYKDGIYGAEEIRSLRDSGFPSLDKKDALLEEIKSAKSAGDSVGGTVECVIYGLKGVGDNLFCGLEGKISSLVFAVPAVKGVEFGDGFNLAAMRGSVANDPLRIENGQVKIVTNRAGGINGGIANGNPITLRTAFRPTPSISLPQKTVDLIKGENTEIVINGRHDACVAVRALPAVESAVAIAIADEIL